MDFLLAECELWVWELMLAILDLCSEIGHKCIYSTNGGNDHLCHVLFVSREQKRRSEEQLSQLEDSEKEHRVKLLRFAPLSVCPRSVPINSLSLQLSHNHNSHPTHSSPIILFLCSISFLPKRGGCITVGSWIICGDLRLHKVPATQPKLV